MFDTFFKYKCSCKQNDTIADRDIIVHIFSFKSTISKQRYIVRIEDYGNEVYTLKFYLYANRLSKKRYSIISNINEPAPVLRTCINIMIDFYHKHSKSSFIIIGASEPNSKKDFKNKRYRVYEKIITNFFNPVLFEHRTNEEKNVYVLINRTNTSVNVYIQSLINQFL